MRKDSLPYRLLKKEVPIAPLIIFRVLFGCLMLFSLSRFVVYGWIDQLYLQPKIFFSYYGFEWVKNPGAPGIYLLFAAAFVGAAGVLAGFLYRFSAVIFFLSFTYLELIDKTNYLNHYYFVSLVSFIMIFLPAAKHFSADVRLVITERADQVPVWMINLLKLQLAIVYCYAGIAKLNAEWLLDAMPLRIWLQSFVHFPLVGELLAKEWVAYFFSWFGAIYDLFIVFFLLNARTRPYAYFFVVSFHVLTWILFPIGVFPWVMIAFSTIFLAYDTHEKILDKLKKLFRWKSSNDHPEIFSPSVLLSPLFILFITFQLLFPWRYLLYPGDVYWTEQGFRFSWRVMLMEKAAYATFYVTDPETGRRTQVANYEYLTAQQEKMMSSQPDMLIQFAKILESDYRAKGIKDPVVTAEVYATLNGRRSRLLIDPRVDLTKTEDSFIHKEWITPLPGK